MTLIVSLPQYTQLDDDYMGAARLQEILSSLYGIPVYDDILAKARRQREQIDEAISDNSQVQEILEQHEKHSFYLRKSYNEIEVDGERAALEQMPTMLDTLPEFVNAEEKPRMYNFLQGLLQNPRASKDYIMQYLQTENAVFKKGAV